MSTFLTPNGAVVILVPTGSPGPQGTQSTEPVAITSTPHTLTDLDNAAVLTWAGPATLDVLVPAGLSAGFNVKIVAAGSGSVDVTAAGADLFAPGGLNVLTTPFGTLEIIPIGIDTYTLRGGDIASGSILDFSDPANSGLLPGI